MNTERRPSPDIINVQTELSKIGKPRGFRYLDPFAVDKEELADISYADLLRARWKTNPRFKYQMKVIARAFPAVIISGVHAREARRIIIVIHDYLKEMEDKR